MLLELEVLGVDRDVLARVLYALRTGRPLHPIAGAGSYSAYAEAAALNHTVGKTSWSLPTVSLALCTVVPTVSSTGSTITEASYTGYARQTIAGAAWAAATGSNPASSVNSSTVTFAACTGGSSTVIGWALCDATTAGNAIMWGSCTSTVISTTQTPATVAASALSLSLT